MKVLRPVALTAAFAMTTPAVAATPVWHTLHGKLTLPVLTSPGSGYEVSLWAQARRLTAGTHVEACVFNSSGVLRDAVLIIGDAQSADEPTTLDAGDKVTIGLGQGNAQCHNTATEADEGQLRFKWRHTR